MGRPFRCLKMSFHCGADAIQDGSSCTHPLPQKYGVGGGQLFSLPALNMSHPLAETAHTPAKQNIGFSDGHWLSSRAARADAEQDGSSCTHPLPQKYGVGDGQLFSLPALNMSHPLAETAHAPAKQNIGLPLGQS